MGTLYCCCQDTKHYKLGELDRSEIVLLNIKGWTKYVSRSLLLSAPNSKLSQMFTGMGSFKSDKAGQVVIEREPAQFGLIIEFLANPSEFH